MWRFDFTFSNINKKSIFLNIDIFVLCDVLGISHYLIVSKIFVYHQSNKTN
jgi:hypothetical protein